MNLRVTLLSIVLMLTTLSCVCATESRLLPPQQTTNEMFQFLTVTDLRDVLVVLDAHEIDVRTLTKRVEVLESSLDRQRFHSKLMLACCVLACGITFIAVR